MRGKVISWNQHKHYGFIRCYSNGVIDGERFEAGVVVFTHLSNLIPNLVELKRGQEVEFELVKGQKGLIANEVRIIRKHNKDRR